MRDIIPGKTYKHFKGNKYYVIGIGEHTETGEAMVIYRRNDGSKIYVRPYAMFASKVDREKYPETTQEYRFELIEGE